MNIDKYFVACILVLGLVPYGLRNGVQQEFLSGRLFSFKY